MDYSLQAGANAFNLVALTPTGLTTRVSNILKNTQGLTGRGASSVGSLVLGW